MIYKKFQDMEISALGFGSMRLPLLDEKQPEKINKAQVYQMVDYAIANGVNYFDTAWGYHEGQSEPTVGGALNRHPRGRFYLASKFPGYDLENMTKVEEIFEEQLKRCLVEYFDFYLFHNVCARNIEHYLDDGQYGIYSYLTQQKKRGRIRHLGFSVHGDCDIIRRFLDAYGEDMEFCQIQLNWVDYHFQDAKSKIDLLRERNIPIWVMEPMRGGMLADLPEEYTERLRKMRPDEEIPAWSFRFLETIPDVVVTLSGVSNFQQLRNNIEMFREGRPLSDEEREELFAIAGEMTQKNTLPCTACRYCTSHCPQELDIPELLSLYNEHLFTGGGFIAPMRLDAYPEEKRPSACVGCKSCEAVCPQEIKISEAMSEFAKSVKPGLGF